MPHAAPSSLWGLSSSCYLVSGTNHEVPHYAVFSSLLILPPSKVQISFWEPYSQTPPTCVLPEMWERKFQTHVKLLRKL
jgi:hypothetical protein